MTYRQWIAYLKLHLITENHTQPKDNHFSIAGKLIKFG